MKRRLAAILAADVVGYTRLMGADEAGTLERLKAHRKDFVAPKIAEHKGRIVKLMGDGLLAEFASVVDAVACAAALQGGMAERNADLPDARRNTTHSNYWEANHWVEFLIQSKQAAEPTVNGTPIISGSS